MAGSALLEDAASALLEDAVSTLLEEFLESLDLVDEPAESSRLSLLRMTDEEDSAELSIAISLELERRFPLEAGMTEEEDSAELSAGMTDAEGDASSEHAAKQAIKAAHPITTNL